MKKILLVSLMSVSLVSVSAFALNIPTPTPTPTPAATPTPTPTPKAKAPEKVTCSEYTGVPLAKDDVVTLGANEVATVNVQDNDVSKAAIAVASTKLIDAENNETTSVYAEGKGEWTVDEESGKVLFDPVQDFSGTASITYVVKDTCANTSNAGTITVNYGEETSEKNDDTQKSDSASVFSNFSMIMMMIFTMSIGLLYIRKEEV